MMLSLIDKYTWQIEAAVVAVILATVVIASGNSWIEWVGAAAVLFNFMHNQVADRLVEKQEEKAKPDVECWPWLHRYFFMKEGLWLVYFVMSETWSALVGVFIFLVYPLWRNYWRKKEAVL